MQLSEELTSTENKVAFARQAFNDSVMHYNTQRETFPDSLVANNFGFKEAALLQIENPGGATAPQGLVRLEPCVPRNSVPTCRRPCQARPHRWISSDIRRRRGGRPRG